MQILEHGQEQERTLLFFCTADGLCRHDRAAFRDGMFFRWCDGHQPEYLGDFTFEQTVDEVNLKSHGVSRLGGAYGCSMGGACLTRMLALEMPMPSSTAGSRPISCPS